MHLIVKKEHTFDWEANLLFSPSKIVACLADIHSRVFSTGSSNRKHWYEGIGIHSRQCLALASATAAAIACSRFVIIDAVCLLVHCLKRDLFDSECMTIGDQLEFRMTSTSQARLGLIHLVSTYSKGNAPFSSSSEPDVTGLWLSREFSIISLSSVPFSRLHSIRIGRSPSGWHNSRTDWSFCAVCDCDWTLKRGGSVKFTKEQRKSKIM